jgi:hypothetical protein
MNEDPNASDKEKAACQKKKLVRDLLDDTDDKAWDKVDTVVDDIPGTLAVSKESLKDGVELFYTEMTLIRLQTRRNITIKTFIHDVYFFQIFRCRSKRSSKQCFT